MVCSVGEGQEMNLREWALPVYTILFQLATGSLFILWVIRTLYSKKYDEKTLDKIVHRPVLVIFFTLLFALVGAHFHLSNPLQSFLTVSNFLQSWLSREIVFTVLAFLTCGALIDQLNTSAGKSHHRITILGWLAISFGAASIFCMSNIYRLPTQPYWNQLGTILLFLSSAVITGVLASIAFLVMDTIFIKDLEPDLDDVRNKIILDCLGWLPYLAIFTGIAITAINVLQILFHKAGGGMAESSMGLLFGLYLPLFIFRFAFLFVGMGTFLFISFSLRKKKNHISDLVVPVYVACFLVLLGEILGRFLFYATHVRIGI
jgi:anaerobic dimethyl sulfoxide reductase subunit C